MLQLSGLSVFTRRQTRRPVWRAQNGAAPPNGPPRRAAGSDRGTTPPRGAAWVLEPTNVEPAPAVGPDQEAPGPASRGRRGRARPGGARARAAAGGGRPRARVPHRAGGGARAGPGPAGALWIG